MISKKYNEQMRNYLAKLAQTQNNLGTWQERILAERKPTNADRIRAMSDEELAEWMVTFPMSHEDVCPKATPENCIGSNGYDLGACKKCWLDWLRQEVSE